MISRLHTGRGRRLTAGAALLGLALTGLGAGSVGTAAAAPADRTSAVDAKPVAAGPGRYLVTFADEPAATYEGNIRGYPRTRPDAGKKLDPSRSEVVKYRARLAAQHDAALRAVGATKIYDYSVTNNGVAVQLTGAQASALAARPEVVGLEKDALRTLDTTASPAFLGLSGPGGLWETLGGANGDRTAGKGVIVGIIDSGIWPESASFAGSTLRRNKAGQPVEASGVRIPWSGACVQGEQFSSQACNDKLIGARFYVDGFGKQNIAKGEYLSPRDGAGHGSHVASTAVGNKVENVTIDGTNYGTASGMAPGARVAAYKVCWEAKPGASAGCFNSDSVAAINDAVADGVDVINYSVGSSSESSPLDSVEQAYRRAANVGVFVAASAGNSGPGASTLDHPSPWLTTVAASTFRSSTQAVQLGNGARYVGASLTGTLPTQTPLVRSTSVALASADPTEARLCYRGTLDPAKAAGKVVQCDRGVIARIDKSFAVKDAGGVGMILTNTSENSLNSDLHAVPSVHLAHTDRQAILDYIAAGANPTAAIVPLAGGEAAPAVPSVAAFSSRGPSTTTDGDILKPDIAAPGVDVIAAVAPPSNNGRSYDAYSGTSMSSPHIAGLAALVRSEHPTWSPMAVKSALMTTARDHATTTDPFAQGAGFVRPSLAIDPGLVFDAGADDWRSFMVTLGVRFAPPFDTLPAVDGSDLNQASIAVGALAGSQTVTRTVTNVGTQDETYTVSSAVPGVELSSSPSTFTLAPGAKQTLQITVTRTDAALGEYAKGTATLTGNGGHVVRIPVAVRPVAISAPTEVSESGTSGSRTFSVTPGFTGTLATTVTGLVGATPSTGVVSSGAVTETDSASTKVFTVEVPAGTEVARFDVDAIDDGDDLDLFVLLDGEEVAFSASAAGDEQVTLTDPEPGTYTVLVNGYETSRGGAFAYTGWVVGGGDLGNLTVSPASTPVTLAQPVDLTVAWSGLDATKKYLGYLSYSNADERTLVSIG